MDNIEFLAVAFLVFWGLTFLYMFSVARRQKNLEQDVQLLEGLVKEEGTE